MLSVVAVGPSSTPRKGASSARLATLRFWVLEHLTAMRGMVRAPVALA